MGADTLLCAECDTPITCRDCNSCTRHKRRLSIDVAPDASSGELVSRPPFRKPMPQGWPLSMVMGNFQGLRCEEASTLSTNMFIPCSKQVEAAVWHDKDRRLYMMCHSCASHNIMNRGGRLVIDGTKGCMLVEEVSRREKWKNWGNIYG